jgi:hypothetical protein
MTTTLVFASIFTYTNLIVVAGNKVCVDISGNEFWMRCERHQEVDVGGQAVDVVLGQTGVKLAQC